MKGKYKINRDFVVPEPTAAKHFAYLTEEQYKAGEFEPILDGWRDAGVQQGRVTIVNDEYPHEPYPHGVWLEGWTDKLAQQLPFGEAEQPDGPIWPPLVHENGKLAVDAPKARQE